MNFGDLRSILKYVPQFRGRTFVVALDGGVVASGNFSNFLIDLAVLRSLGVRVVLVFGASQQIRTLGEKRGVDLSCYDGLGPTDQATLEVSLDAISRLTTEVMQSLATIGIRAASSNALTVRPAGIIKGVEQHFTGRIDDVDAASLTTLLDQNLLPVVAPLGYDAKGRTLRLNSDAAAAEVAMSLKAAKVLYVCQDWNGPFLHQAPKPFSVQAAETLLGQPGHDLTRGITSKLRYGVRACRESVARVHLIPGHHEEALLAELFSNEGIGIMVHSDSYQVIRQANVRDLDHMHSLMQRAVEDEQLVGRSRDEIRRNLDDYWVMEVDGNVVGCVALHVFPEQHCAEVASLFIQKAHVGRGYGRALLENLEKVARETGISNLFAFTTQAPEFFTDRCGFSEETDLNRVPESRLDTYKTGGRKSRLFWKEL